MLSRRCAVLGSPIGHSLSPRLHLAAYSALGLDWRYDRYDVEVDRLPGFVAALGPEWVGLSVTMPLKEAALALADEAEPVALRVGAANTLLLGDGTRALNTDVPGLQGLLADHWPQATAAPEPGDVGRHPAAVLGGGATARAVLVALAGWTDGVVLAVRDPSRVGDLQRLELAYPVAVVGLDDPALRRDVLARPLVVSTAPAAALDWLAADVAGTEDRFVAGGQLFVDVGYDPWPSRLAAAYEARGATVTGGLELLVRQAALQVEAMTGRPAPLREMWAAVDRQA